MFSVQIQSAEPIFRGLRNLKWIITLSGGKKWFVKHYDSKRYKGKLPFVKNALVIQEMIRQQGIVCPKIYSIQGEYILTTPRNIHFSVMNVCVGEVVNPGQANVPQLYSLGYELGKMHHALQKIPPDTLDWIPSKDEIQISWERQYEAARKEGSSERVLRMLEQQQDILGQIDFSLFQISPQGWTHWDMQLNNVLFLTDRVSGIVDFDRMRYVYPELDVARAVLSGCIDDKGMNHTKLEALLQGYQQWFPNFRRNDLNRAFQLLWTKESAWWITADIDRRSEIPRRFFEEMKWLQENWGRFNNYYI